MREKNLIHNKKMALLKQHLSTQSHTTTEVVPLCQNFLYVGEHDNIPRVCNKVGSICYFSLALCYVPMLVFTRSYSGIWIISSTILSLPSGSANRLHYKQSPYDTIILFETCFLHWPCPPHNQWHSSTIPTKPLR